MSFVVAYRESIRRRAKARGVYRDDRGGQRAPVECEITVEPHARGAGIQFIHQNSRAFPASLLAAAEDGVRDALQAGPLGGFPVTDVRAGVLDGSRGASEQARSAFRRAAALATRDAVAMAEPFLLEPIDLLRVTFATSSTNSVIGELSRRRGNVLDATSDAEGAFTTITAEVPRAETATLADDLSTLTNGAGTYVVKGSVYRERPSGALPLP